MNKTYFTAGLITTLINLLLNASAYFFILKDIYRKYPAVSTEFMNQLHRQPDQLIMWAMAVTSLAMGFLITTVIKWSGAKTFITGLKYGFIFALLFWGSINFGLYASSNFFSQVTVFADYVCSVSAMTISGAITAMLLGREKKIKI